MKESRLKVVIERPADEVYAFAVNPENTPKWIDGIVHEETNEWPVRVGSLYRNQNTNGEWSEYVVTELVENRIFTLAQKDSDYHVRYTFSFLDDSSSELEYHEWVEKGDLKEPFTKDTLEKLKEIIETI